MVAIAIAVHGETQPALNTTITTMGQTTYAQIGTSSICQAYGYSNGVDYLILPNFGTIGSATYTDGGSNSRTISGIYYTEIGCSDPDEDDLFFCLNATSIPNTDTTFVSIQYGGTTYTRSSATYTASTGSCSTWRWLNINPDGPTIGTPTLKVFI